jgi:hypothetical protein
MNRRKTVSVTPDIGASTVAGRISTPPIRTHSGTRAPRGGAAGVAGVSHFLFTPVL